MVERQPRGGAPAPTRGSQAADRALARVSEPSSPAAPPGASYRAPRRESEEARRERLSTELAERNSLRADKGLNDPILFRGFMTQQLDIRVVIPGLPSTTPDPFAVGLGGNET